VTTVAGTAPTLPVTVTATMSDGTGIWTVKGLTLQSGDIISVTAQVTGDTICNAVTATVAAAQTVTPTITETPNSGYTIGWSRNRRQ